MSVLSCYPLMTSSPPAGLHNTNPLPLKLTNITLDTDLHLHGVELVPELQLVGDLVDGGETAQAAAKLITDLLERPRHLRRVHGGVHLDTILVSP